MTAGIAGIGLGFVTQQSSLPEHVPHGPMVAFGTPIVRAAEQVEAVAHSHPVHLCCEGITPLALALTLTRFPFAVRGLLAVLTLLRVRVGGKYVR